MKEHFQRRYSQMFSPMTRKNIWEESLTSTHAFHKHCLNKIWCYVQEKIILWNFMAINVLQCRSINTLRNNVLVSHDHMTLFEFHILVCNQKYMIFYNDLHFAKTIIRFVHCYHLHAVSPPFDITCQHYKLVNQQFTTIRKIISWNHRVKPQPTQPEQNYLSVLFHFQ